MTETKFTPGPWVQFVMDGECRAIMPAGRDGDICGFDLALYEANAAIMTAAPEMFAALQLIRSRLDEVTCSHECAVIDAVISKASPHNKRSRCALETRGEQ